MGMLWCLKVSYVLLGILLLILLVHSADSNVQVKDDLQHEESSSLTNTTNATSKSNEQNVGANMISDPKIVTPFKKEEQVEKSKEVVKNDELKSSTSDTLESKDTIEINSKDGSTLGFLAKDKESVNVGFDSKQVIVKDKENGNAGGSLEGNKSKQVINKDEEGENTGGSEEVDSSEQTVNKDEESGNAEGSRIDDSKGVTNKDKESNHTTASKGFDANQVSEEDDNKESSGSSTVVKEKMRDDECDPSNMCVDKRKNLTACLRVTGNDSPDLSLQIWNKGTKPFIVSITAPAFVQLEERKIYLQPTEDKKVRVSIAYDGADSLIFLTAEDTRCELNFRDLVPHDDARVESHYAFKLRYLNNWTQNHIILLLTLTAFLAFGCAWMHFRLHKKLFIGNGYQAVEVELPVSNVTKLVPETNDGWDNGWDDNWDDEESPMTPTLPATPNLSSRGLASRRLSKDAWKD